MNFAEKRQLMVAEQLKTRGISDSPVLAAMSAVPRELFVPDSLQEYAYDDVALPIEEQQTISQPFIVALMAQTLQLTREDRVLEVGTGSGYAAAVFSQLAKEVYSVERHAHLAHTARERLKTMGCSNVTVLVGDGTLGLPEHAPYSAISVAAGGESVPRALLLQLAKNGRLVIPVGPSLGQLLMRITKDSEGGYQEETLGSVRFVPLKKGLPKEISTSFYSEKTAEARSKAPGRATLENLLKASAERITSIEHSELSPLLERTEPRKVILLGASTHGSAEFYRMRARISLELIALGRVQSIALEADWSDAQALNRYIHGKERAGLPLPFPRFPGWVWGNKEFEAFLHKLREINLARPSFERVSIYGLDLYDMSSAIAAVIKYLEDIDPELAQEASARYRCLSPWELDPPNYGRAVLSGAYSSCAAETEAVLAELISKQTELRSIDEEAYFNALQNARLINNAERYYRTLYHKGPDAWNSRALHMFETLNDLVTRSPEGKQVLIWAHNAHIGNGAATEQAQRGEVNLGRLCRENYGDSAYLIGFGTHVGTVAAAPSWGEKVQRMELPPSLRGSYERLFAGSNKDAFFLPLTSPNHPELPEALAETRPERSIGVIYQAEQEHSSSYLKAQLPQQFDEYVWFNATSAVTPLNNVAGRRFKGNMYPTGL